MPALHLPLNSKHLAQQDLINHLMSEGMPGSLKDPLALTPFVASPLSSIFQETVGPVTPGQECYSLKESQAPWWRLNWHSDVRKKRRNDMK